MKKIKGSIIISGFSIGVIALWFLMGFVFPLLFPNSPNDAGSFGDGFGSVNALFSGLGFIALSYTLYLQIQEHKKDKKSEKFNLHLKLIDDIKSDLENFYIIGPNVNIHMKGYFGINIIANKITKYPDEFNDDRHKSSLVYLSHSLAQIDFLLSEIKTYNPSKKQYALLLNKTTLLFSAYFGSLRNNILDTKNTNPSLRNNTEYQILKEYIFEINSRIETLKDDLEYKYWEQNMN